MKVLRASREMYNSCLEELITHYQETGKHLHLYEQDKHHGKAQHPDLPAVLVDTTLKRLHRSFTHFFQGRKNGRPVGFPRFKSATAWNTIQWNGTAWNGTAWNGTAWNGTAWNGTAWNSGTFS